MNFSFEVTVPAGTPENNPITVTWHLAEGLIYEFSLLSYVGTNGYVFCRIEDVFCRPVFPHNPNSYYRLYGQEIWARYPSCKYRLTGRNMDLIFKGWAPDAQYDHVITANFWIVKPEDIPVLYHNKEELRGLLNG